MTFMKRILLLIALTIAAACVHAAVPVERSQTVVYIDGEKFYIHTVRKGDTLYAIARCYEVSEQTLLEYNPSAADGLKIDQTLRIPLLKKQDEERPLTAKEEKRRKKTFIEHTVAPGETLYAVSRRYEISVETILEDNENLDPRNLSVGQTLLIRKKEIGRTDEEQIRSELTQYAEALNGAEAPASGYAYYVVQPRETVYSLARRYGMTEQEFIALNDLQDGLKAGAIIRVPCESPVAATDQPTAPADTTGVTEGETTPPAEIVFHALRPSERLQVALLLPLSAESGTPNTNFTAFYQGFLLGLETVKSRGYSVDLNLFDTRRSPERVEQLTQEPRFRQAQLIVGPVYEQDMQPVIRYAEERGIPVVTPLADLKEVGSDALFQMAPPESHKYDKLASLLDKEADITLIRTERNDREFEKEILDQLQGRSFEYYDYQSVQGADNASRSDLTPLLKRHDKHLFFVLADNEVDVDRILASLASAQTNMQARGFGNPEYTVVGHARWNRYVNIDRTTFFKNRVVLFSIFHAKRDSEEIRRFDTEYIRAFGSMPSLYSYRGYETAVIFCPGMYSDIEYDMEGRRYKPLQTTYTFRQEPNSPTHVNQEWVRINYNSDFTITLE